ncbi:MAG TPA: O-acetylhomoserine aminocarboxypropyltransferase/cysteine synthase [Sulfurovum sp.]|jgi:O-acetylhomoserine (thiol)-lyase|nr:MAG: O-acetylhomoserine aminocarboxypropyltransferase [Sulfurovum sp. 35-42-20]OYY56591.1 MAG: O-acetylhomoserine aminocarboxypropyltransferase [Sulfurovum sp. 28-43-6]OYZ24147.1 MAG: O-acetylhomoserine aminocarboxypropyltransferase [Sulfurovum sp. 16-42-52]OYZ47855.1 MAG: O-acetylhomoserine aminocarboxypropyltransferase [Sulfurovum sp. 24-42-9]OZA43997.1 MAG: O-acetylhomoserine aminocarboxypropyltransferase [Sulfurovum sp. 17-42-90]OZA61467.1 MAG: O-acetylhomoserine aminocarboxypropyltrans
MHEQTLAIHAGYEKDAQGTMAVPIYMSTAYEFRDTEHAANLFALKELGNIYTRLMNPTTDVFEKRFAALEGGVAAVGTASGMAAIFYAIANVAEAGDNIIVAKQVYGGTTTLTGHTIKRFGIETRYFDVGNPSEIEALVDDKTKIILFESITNPSVDVADFDAIVAIANKHNILTCVDNTVGTPILCKPFEHGVDLSVHSASKYTTGQGLAIGGVIVERHNLVEKIKGNARYAHFNEPDASYHGLVYSDVPLPLFTLRVRLALLRDLGAAPSPFNSWLYIQGLETLPLRMKQHSSSALAIAEFLEAHPKVKKVNYPGLKSDSNHALAQKYFKNGYSGLLSFEVEDTETAQKIADSTEIFSLVVNIGDSKSIITHPASTTHQQLSAQELIEAGVPGGLVRLSVGIEDTQDLINDLARALG